MLRRLNYIVLMMISLVAHAVAGEPHVVDKVCRDAVRTYRVNQGNAASVLAYTWLLTDASGASVPIPSGDLFNDVDVDGNPVKGSEIQINWSFNPAIYTLTVQKQSEFACTTDTAGTIEVVPVPEVFAGDDLIVCDGNSALLDKATAANFSSLVWETDGDGVFDDPTTLNPVYTPGPADKIAGSVTLRITAEGLGDEGSCIPVTDELKLSIIYIEATVNSSRITCFGANDGTITIYEKIPGTYEYNVGSGWISDYYIQHLKPGTYIVQIRDPLIASCAVTLDTIEIEEPPVLSATVIPVQPTCFGGNGSITVSYPDGGWGTYQYRLNNDDWKASGSFTKLGPFDYDVQIRDASFPDCVLSLGIFTIALPDELEATAIATPVKCPGGNTGSISVQKVSGGSGNYEFTVNGTDWQTSPDFASLIAGTYPVLMRDALDNSCEKFIANIDVLEPFPIVATVTPTDVSCFGAKDGKIEVSAPANGTPPYEYSIDGSPWQASGLFENLGPKTYSVQVRDANKCISPLGVVKISQPAKLEFKPVKTNETIAGANDGTITVTAQAGGWAPGNYKYSIDGTTWDINPVFAGLAPAAYTIQMRDELATACFIDSVVIIYPAGTVSADFTPKNVTCYGGSDGQITFSNPSGASNYQFSVDGGTSWQTSPTFSGLIAGSYLLMVGDADNPDNSALIDLVELTEPKEITATVSFTPETVPGANNAKITISNPKGGSNVYEYSLDGTNWVTTTVFTGLTTGTYTVWIQDKNVPGCYVQIPKTILPAGSLTADVAHADILCKGDDNGSITISNPLGASFYDFSIDGGSKWLPSDVFTGLKAGVYDVMLRDRFNTLNKVLLEKVTITEPNAKIRARYDITEPPLCAGATGTVMIFATGGTGVKTGTGYFDMVAGEKRTFEVTDENGCADQVTVSMPNPAKILATGTVIAPLCFGDNGTVTISATGGTGDLFVNGVKMVAGKLSYSIAGGKVYSFMVNDSNGCFSIPISGTMPNAPAQLLVTFSGVKDVSCFGGNDGTATAVATGGTAGYTYRWNDPAKQTTQTATGLTKGTYSVTVTDKNNCQKIELVTISEQPALVAPTIGVVQMTCAVVSGTITVNTPVPAAGITYTVTGTNPVRASVTNATGVFSGLAWGVYDVITTNAFGCSTAPISATINFHPGVPAVPTPIPVAPVCETSPTQTLNANNYIVPPVAGVSFVWYDAPTGGNVVAAPTLNTAKTVTYYAEATNGECVSVSRIPVTLTIIPRPIAPLSSGDLSACESSPMVTLDALNAIVPSSIKNIKWYNALTGGSQVSVPTLNSVGTVTYYAENNGGLCASSPRVPVTLTIYALPSKPVVAVIEQPKCIDSEGALEVTSPLGPQYVYSVDNGPYQSSVFFNKPPGTHFIRVRNLNTTCESDTTVIRVKDIPPVPHIKKLTAEDCICYGDSGKLNFEFENVVDGTYVIVYVGGQFNNVKVVAGKASILAPAGTYNVLAIEANGCTSPEKWDIEIKQPDQISVSATITEIDLKSGQRGEIDLTITGGTGSYQTIWTPNPINGFVGASTEDIKNLDSGIYVVTVTDVNGCQKQYIDTIPKANLPPIATNDEFEAGCGGIKGDLLYTDNGNGTDSDPDGDLISIDTTPISVPLHGTLTIHADGTFEYFAVQGYTGDDTFRYTIYDVKKNYSIPATVIIHVVSDFDCDGFADDVDDDADGDGILNVDEGGTVVDTDGDGHPNWLDIDDDNDGIVDNIEAQLYLTGYIPPSGKHTDNDGLDDIYDTDQNGTNLKPVDSDGDGIPDFLDADSDNDGVPDYIEGHDGDDADGKPAYLISGKDFDDDGLDDVYDTVNRFVSPYENMTGSNSPLQDFDGDGLNDWRDENDDDDEYLTRFEDLNMDGDFSNDDTDRDGHPEYLDYGRDCDLFIPNAFSPNDDNVHDYFQIYCIDHFPNARIYIFDQLGNKLYEQKNYGNIEAWGTADRAWWDGRTTNRDATTTSGGKVIPGTYYYVLQLGNGEVKKSFVFVSY